MIPGGAVKSFNHDRVFHYAVRGVYQSKVDGRIKFHTYAGRE